jgi:hypothetical protein
MALNVRLHDLWIVLLRLVLRLMLMLRLRLVLHDSRGLKAWRYSCSVHRSTAVPTHAPHGPNGPNGPHAPMATIELLPHVTGRKRHHASAPAAHPHAASAALQSEMTRPRKQHMKK